MPVHAPDDIKDEDERNLYRDLSRLYEDYLGDKEEEWDGRRIKFVAITGHVMLDVMIANMKKD